VLESENDISAMVTDDYYGFFDPIESMNATDLKSSVSLRRIKWNLFLLGLFKIPLLFYVSPKIIEISPDSCIIKIKLRRRTKNHLNSMYFGAMAVGADVAVGLHAFYLSELKKS
jgi:hypothetical protein